MRSFRNNRSSKRRTLRFAATALILAMLTHRTAITASAALGDCGQPLSTGTEPTASDALFALNAAVGLVTCSIRSCDVDASCSITAVDALRILRRSVGLPVVLSCDGCLSSTTTLSPPTTTTTTLSPPLTMCGTFALQWGSLGSSSGLLSGPRGIAVRANQEIFVVDSRNDRVQVFNAIGTFLRQFGSNGQGLGELDRPRYAAFDTADNFYVTDRTNNRIEKFNGLGIEIGRAHV